MDKKVLFNEALASLVEFASANGNVLTTSDVKVHFSDIIEDDSQYKFLYEYLTSSKISISDLNNDKILKNNKASTNTDDNIDVVSTDILESEEELSFIEMYLSELNGILPITKEELNLLLEKHVSGDGSVTNRIIESQLSLVASIAENYRGKGVNMGDLIQEGNIALMDAISHYSDLNVDFTDYIATEIKHSLDLIVNKEINADRIGDRLAKKLNQLDNVTRDLNEKLGRVPNVDEIAESMNINREEAEMLLKTSLDTLSVNEDDGIEDDVIPGDDSVDYGETFAPKQDPLNWKYSKK